MKKIRLTIISLLLVFALTACGSEDIVNTTDAAGSTDVQTTAPDTEAPDTETPDTEAPDTAATTPSTETAGSVTEETTPESPDTAPSAGNGIFDGLTLSEIWDKVMGNLSDSTGLDVSVASKSEYTMGENSQQEEQTVHILLNAAENGYSYAIETVTKRILPELTYTESSYQAYKDGWFYQSNSTDETGTAVWSFAKIAMTLEELTEQGLDPETILALNVLADMSIVSFEGKDLEKIFDKVEYIELEDGRSKIVCKGMQVQQLLDTLLGSLGEGLGDGDDLSSLGALFTGLAELMECDMTLGIAANGMPESISAAVSLEMSDPIPFAVRTEYTLTVNAAGAGAGKVTLPAETDRYPEYESFGDYLKEAVGNLIGN